MVELPLSMGWWMRTPYSVLLDCDLGMTGMISILIFQGSRERTVGFASCVICIYDVDHLSIIGEYEATSHIQDDPSSSKEGLPTGRQETHRTSPENCHVAEVDILRRRKRYLPNGEISSQMFMFIFFDGTQVEARSQAKFNRFLRAGTVLK